MASLLSKTHVENKVEEETNCVHLYHLSSPSGMYTFLKVNIMEAAEPSRGSRKVLLRTMCITFGLHMVCYCIEVCKTKYLIDKAHCNWKRV